MNGRKRPTKEQLALMYALTARLGSEDPHFQVGACSLYHNKRVAGVGFNGAPSNIDLDWLDRNARRDFVSHAEINALENVKAGECWLIAVTTLPCCPCLTFICNKGIKRVVYLEEVQKQTTLSNICRESVLKAQKHAKKLGIELVKISIPNEWRTI